MRLTDAHREAYEERIAELEAALDDAIVSIADWGAYADEYFQTKHDLAGEIARLTAIRARKQERDT